MFCYMLFRISFGILLFYVLQEYAKLYSVEMTYPNNSPQRLFRASTPAHQTGQAYNREMQGQALLLFKAASCGEFRCQL